MSEKRKVEHPIHKAVGHCIEAVSREHGFTCFLDPACGGTSYLPLFAGDRARATETCKVDALVVIEGRVRLVVEVEESDIKPTQILGKFLTTALSKHFMNDKLLGSGAQANLSECAFLQIAYTGKLSNGSQKPAQLNLLRDEIKKRFLCSPISGYELLMISNREEAGRQVEDRLQSLLGHSIKPPMHSRRDWSDQAFADVISRESPRSMALLRH